MKSKLDRDRLTLAWTYRQWALDTANHRAPKLISRLRAGSGYLALDEAQSVLALLQSHCLVVSGAVRPLVRANLGGPVSDAGQELFAAMGELDGLLGQLASGRTNSLIPHLLYMEEVGWMSVESTILRYGQAGLLSPAAPLGVDARGSAITPFLYGLSSGRITRQDAATLVASIQNASLLGSGMHFRATRRLVRDRRRGAIWH